MADRYWPPMMHPFLFCDVDVTPHNEAGTNRHGSRSRPDRSRSSGMSAAF